VWNDQAEQDFVLDTASPLVDLIFDEGDWILKASKTEFTLPDADADGVPDGADNCELVANPAQPDADGDTLGDACDEDDDGDAMPDAEDCAALDPAQGTPAEVPSLDVTAGPASVAHLAWSPAARADAYDLSRGSLSALRASADYGTCLAPLVVGLGFDDGDLPPAGDGWLYLVRGHDTGCGGGGSLGSSSSGTPRPSPCP
jgi:hypothetical protein